MSYTLPAGRYVVTDPCYVLGIENDDWNDILEETDFFNVHRDEERLIYNCSENQKGVFTRKGMKYFASHTKYGDGGYTLESEGGFEIGSIGVDSGTIACIPVEICEDDLANFELHGLGTMIEMKEDFTCNFDGENIKIGPYVIRTGDDDDDWGLESKMSNWEDYWDDYDEWDE